MIYLDHAATTPPRREALEAMWPYLTEVFANPSSAHEPGRRAKAALDQARASVAAGLSCRPGEVIFTSGGTEANNLALIGIALGQPRGRHVVVSAVEHKAVMETALWLRDTQGFALDVVGVDADGVLDLAQLDAVLRTDTTLVSVMYANNEVGTVQPIEAIAARCAASSVPLHTDAVQAAGQLPLDVATLGVQAMSLSAHKFGGPRGIGALVVSGEVALEPVVHGGGQERGRRSGTSDVASAVGLAVALAAAERDRLEVAQQEVLLRDRLIDGLLGTIPSARLTGSRTERLPNHASFCFPGLNGEAILQGLEGYGVVASSGSACSAESEEASDVLLAMGLDEATARTAVRFTLGTSTTAADIDVVLAALPAVLLAVSALE